MAVHCLKTWPEYFQKVRIGAKSCDVRKNDRDYKVGDVLLLCEYDPASNLLTGAVVKVEVTDLVDNPEWLCAGFVAMSIKLRAGGCFYFVAEMRIHQDVEQARRLAS